MKYPTNYKLRRRWKLFPRKKLGPKRFLVKEVKVRTIRRFKVKNPPGAANAWRAINWVAVRRFVSGLQIQIFASTKAGNMGIVHSLQDQLVTSREARLLATRRVSQDNTGRRTAGLDGLARLKPGQKYHLAERHLDLADFSASPTLRVWIPKPGTTEQRPLGIPTMLDRARQALVVLALDPEWKAKFEPNSFGFRPGRRAHDAVKVICTTLVHATKFVYDADVAKCFDRIDHEALLAKLSQPKGCILYRCVESWLKAGIMERNEGPFPEPHQLGTPQGGVISPLLANIALHGL
jgi:RNA-directed DNA polymerase